MTKPKLKQPGRLASRRREYKALAFIRCTPPGSSRTPRWNRMAHILWDPRARGLAIELRKTRSPYPRFGTIHIQSFEPGELARIIRQLADGLSLDQLSRLGDGNGTILMGLLNKLAEVG